LYIANLAIDWLFFISWDKYKRVKNMRSLIEDYLEQVEDDKLLEEILDEGSFSRAVERVRAGIPHALANIAAAGTPLGSVLIVLYKKNLSKYKECNKKYSAIYDSSRSLRCKADFCYKMAADLKSQSSKAKDGDEKDKLTIESNKWNSKGDSFKERAINYDK
jgi:uncharacterized protein YfaQ (DUF2300 family)